MEDEEEDDDEDSDDSSTSSSDVDESGDKMDKEHGQVTRNGSEKLDVEKGTSTKI